MSDLRDFSYDIYNEEGQVLTTDIEYYEDTLVTFWYSHYIEIDDT